MVTEVQLLAFCGPQSWSGADKRGQVVEEESKECFSVLAYAEAVTKMADKYGVRDVFLASDNQESMEMLRDLCPDLQFYWQSEVDRTFLSATVEDFEKEE
eukprot:3404454-Rhodomonas_salina.5